MLAYSHPFPGSQSREGKSKERRKSDLVSGARGETLLRQMMDVPSPMEQACQIPSQLLGGRAGTLKVHTRSYPALVNVGRSEGSREASFITSW